MKRTLSLLLAAVLIACAFSGFSLNTSALDADDVLTVTCRGEVIGTVEVGSEFIYHVSLNSGGYAVMGGEAQVRYDSDYVQVVEYGTKNSSGSINMNAYSFPVRIRNASLISNYLGIKNEINYNFTKLSGVGVFEDDDHYFKVRFRALRPGTVEIRHYSYSLYYMKGTKNIRLIHFDKGNDQLDPVPYTLCSVEPAIGLLGDADGDCRVTVTDATYIQLITAGLDYETKIINADITKDGEIDLRDARSILRCQAGLDPDTGIGEWLFESEA